MNGRMKSKASYSEFAALAVFPIGKEPVELS